MYLKFRENQHYEIIRLEELKAFIDKYGVDYRDKLGECLLNFCCHLPETHIDLIMSYKPNFVNSRGRVMISFSYQMKRAPYALQKLLEIDYDFVYVTKATTSEYKPYLQFLRMIYEFYISHKMEDTETYSRIELMMLLLENHEKRYYKLFDLLMMLIDDNNNNKKRRV